MREVAEHFSVYRTTVAAHLKRRSVPVRCGKLTETDLAQIGDLYEQGFTLLEIGMRFGLGQDTARRAVIAAGATIRRPGRRAGEVMASTRQA